MNDVTICICTYGSNHWATKGQELCRKLDKVFPQIVKIAYHEADSNLSTVRNKALELVPSEYIIFVDADDNLSDNYVAEMMQGYADIRVPSVQYISRGTPLTPYVPRVSACTHKASCGPQCLPLGNYLVIGSMARTEALRAVGGFRDWPMYEDWDLWARCYTNGSSFQNIPTAIYKATVRPDSRNRQPSKEKKLACHRAIAEDLGFPIP